MQNSSGWICIAPLLIENDKITILSDLVYSIIDAKHDDRWIVSEAVSKQSNKYYFIIDKNFKADSVPISYIYGTYLLGYTDSLEFAKACKNKNIPLTIGK